MRTRVVHVTAPKQTNLLCYGCGSFMQIGQKLLHEGKLLISNREMFSLSVKYRGGGQLIGEENHAKKTIYPIKNSEN